jgi:hypothetical protein
VVWQYMQRLHCLMPHAQGWQQQGLPSGNYVQAGVSALHSMCCCWYTHSTGSKSVHWERSAASEGWQHMLHGDAVVRGFTGLVP